MSRSAWVIDEEKQRIGALLGPTNTGKTHRAIERMLAYPNGMIGLPLRLLAREVYDRVVRARGVDRVALVTGEEKIVPPNARYFVCTVEAMPVNRRVAFLAIDEVQLAGDRARGHVFTERLLEARGLVETMFLGSDTVEPVLRELVPTAVVDRQPRLSRLSWAGTSKLTRLPPRTAVVAFSAREIYRLAERLRQKHGGTAVVLGALSPRTRNAQVAMYQAGEVQYLVATDAIGMGLNMDVDHVAFAGLRKFDGQGIRDLTPAELSQIAGRAGRFRRDGTFGTTASVGELDPELVRALEEHRFEPLEQVYWRASDLDLHSVDALLRSLERRPRSRRLRSIPYTVDGEALRQLARDPEVEALARGVPRVSLLWEVARIPDYEKTLTDSHVTLLGRVYRYLCSREAALPQDWIAKQVEALDRTEGDIETLMARIARVRTWTFITHRDDWVADARGWQDRTRAIEDRLSDALHDQLTRRFVDHRVMVLRAAAAGDSALEPTVDDDGTMRVGGALAGEVRGLAFRVSGDPDDPAARAARRLATGVLRGRVEQLVAGPDDAFTLTGDAIHWEGGRIARLKRGAALTAPRIGLDRMPDLGEADRARVRERLVARLATWRDDLVAVLDRPAAARLEGGARGILFALRDSLGCVLRTDLAAAVRTLTPRERRDLARLDVRLGTETVYVDGMLTPPRLALRMALAAAWYGTLPLVPAGVPSWPAEGGTPRAWLAAGYQVAGARAVRVDALETLAAWARRAASGGPFELGVEQLGWLGCGVVELRSVLVALGYQVWDRGGLPVFHRGQRAAR